MILPMSQQGKPDERQQMEEPKRTPGSAEGYSPAEPCDVNEPGRTPGSAEGEREPADSTPSSQGNKQ